MPPLRLSLPLPLLTAAVLAAAACGGADGSSAAPARGSANDHAGASAKAAARANRDWPVFGFTPDRRNTASFDTGLNAGNVGRLRRHVVALPGTVDSSPIYLHGVRVRGRVRDVFVMTTTYGRTLAVDAATRRIVWTFTPHGYRTWAGTYRITNTSPVADPDRAHVFAASSDGRIHRLSLANGREARGWPVRITTDPAREKMGASLNFAHGLVIAATGGYIGDQPPYQGHVVTMDRGGRIVGVFNTLCSNRHGIFRPSTCPSTLSAIWSRAGVLVEPNGRLLTTTGNGPFDGRTDWGDSALELTSNARRLLQNWTPRDQRTLEAGDIDVGSTSPALLGQGVVLQAGKAGVMDVLSLRRLNGTGRAGPRQGGQLQVLRTPGGGTVLTAPAVWIRRNGTTVYVANDEGTVAYSVRRGRLHRLWSSGNDGSSPVVAGGLLYVYRPRGGLMVYRPLSGRVVARLPAGGGHWQSPVLGGGRIALPEGNANDHALRGVLNLYALR